MLEELLAAEELVIGVLDPALAQHLVGQVVRVLEDRQPRHQPRRQRRPAGVIGVNLAEPLFQKAPVHRARQRHQRMAHVDDLVEPGAEKILLPRLAPLCVAASNPSPSKGLFSGNSSYTANVVPNTKSTTSEFFTDDYFVARRNS